MGSSSKCDSVVIYLHKQVDLLQCHREGYSLQYHTSQTNLYSCQYENEELRYRVLSLEYTFSELHKEKEGLCTVLCERNQALQQAQIQTQYLENTIRKYKETENHHLCQIAQLQEKLEQVSSQKLESQVSEKKLTEVVEWLVPIIKDHVAWVQQTQEKRRHLRKKLSEMTEERDKGLVEQESLIVKFENLSRQLEEHEAENQKCRENHLGTKSGSVCQEVDVSKFLESREIMSKEAQSLFRENQSLSQELIREYDFSEILRSECRKQQKDIEVLKETIARREQ